MDKTVSEIQIGAATYIIEREFAGSVSREQLLTNRIVDAYKSASTQAVGTKQEIG